jgi:predicted Co/Zn/Cd cation transporter (cation efflux family)
MDLFLTVIISGMAVGGTLSFLSLAIGRWVSDSLLKTLLTIPFAAGANWLLGLTEFTLLVATFGAAFFALVALSLTNRPVVVPQNQFRR